MTVVVVMGVSGCGKSTVAALLAQEQHWDFLEGDSLHPAASIAKMSAGVPLTDADRWPWLAAIAAWIRERTSTGRGAAAACSALKRDYRDLLREGSPDGSVVFAHLAGPRQTLVEHITARHGHFMPAALLDSQLDTLEPLCPDEAGVVVDLRLSPQEQVDRILAWLRENRPAQPNGTA